MDVQVDQAGNDEQAGGVDDIGVFSQWHMRLHGTDGAVTDGDVATCVELIGRIDDVATVDDEVVAHGVGSSPGDGTAAPATSTRASARWP